MAVPTISESVNALVSSTLRDYGDTPQQQIYDAIPLFRMMKGRGKVREVSGGRQIARPVAYKANTTFQQYKGTQVADHTEQDEFTHAFYDWSYARTAIMITDEDLLQNRGDKHVIFNLLDERIENAESTMMDNMSVLLHGGLAGPSGAQFNGLTTLVPSAAGTIGTIDASVETWWDVNRVASATSATLKDSIRDLHKQCIVKVRGPKQDGLVGVTTQAVFQELEDQLETHGRFTLAEKSANSVSFGLDTIFYNGVPIIWDNDAPANTFKFVNTNFLYLVVHPQRNFATTEMKSPFDAEFSVSYIRFAGNLVSEFGDAQGGLFSITL